jgi:hypothetical protein
MKTVGRRKREVSLFCLHLLGYILVMCYVASGDIAQCCGLYEGMSCFDIGTSSIKTVGIAPLDQ